MLSFANLEVALIWPAAILFILVILPVPFLSTAVANLIAKLETIQVGRISILALLWVTGAIFFFYSLYDLNTRFSSDRDEHSSGGPADAHHHGHGHGHGGDHGRNTFLRRKWLAERNMYIHAVLFILYAALQKMARLVLEKRSLEKTVAAKEAVRKNQ